jgi:dTDP-4-amino-4,6-dideoxygalactose transaminase
MDVPILDLRAEYYCLKEEIDAAIQRVIESGSFIMGEELEAFEAEFARYCGADFAVGVGSGTAAIHLTLLACGVGPGDEVITVPNTDLPTTMTISHCGAQIVWVDVDPLSFNIDPEQIEAKITSKTKAILPVHLFGHPAEMDPIMEIARRHNLLVIEDAALAVGAEYKHRKMGTIGDVGCFSLASTKILGAYGDAGIVVTDHREIADQIRVLRNYGHSLEMEEDLIGARGMKTWDLVAEGFNERLDTIQAAILRAKLPTLEDRIRRRRRVAHMYSRLLSELDLITPHEADNVRHVYRAYTVLVDNREQVRDYLGSKDIATRLYYVPLLHCQPVYQRLGLGRGDFPVAEKTADRMLALPVFPEITDDQIHEVVSALQECIAAF